MTRLRLYRNDFHSAVLALTITLGADGAAVLDRGEEAGAAGAAMNMVGEGVPATREMRMVTPADGQEYMDCVEAMFSDTSHWLLVRDDNDAERS